MMNSAGTDPQDDAAVLIRAPDDMARIDGGTFRMGSDAAYPEERPELGPDHRDDRRRSQPRGAGQQLTALPRIAMDSRTAQGRNRAVVVALS